MPCEASSSSYRAGTGRGGGHRDARPRWDHLRCRRQHQDVAALPEPGRAGGQSHLHGNILTAPAPYTVTSITYDYQNLPVSLTRSGVTSTYRYDDAGQRIAKQVGTGNADVSVLDGPLTLDVVTVDSGPRLTVRGRIGTLVSTGAPNGTM